MANSPVTVLNVVNKVLTRLRESKASALADSDYALLVLDLVNDAKREVEDAFNWSSIKDTISLQMTAGQTTVSVADGGSKETTERTRIVQVYNLTEDCYLRQRTREHIRVLANENNDQGNPDFFAINGVDSNQRLSLEIWRPPEATNTMEITVYNPQEDFTSGDEDELILAPWRPIYLRALQLAIRERGDDSGLSSPEAFAEYMTALNDAIAYEQRAMYDNTFEGDWQVITHGF